METEAPSKLKETDAGGGLSTTQINLLIGIGGLIIGVLTCLCGGGAIWRLRNYLKKKRRERRSQRGTSDTRRGSVELKATERAGENDALVSNTSNQTARNSSDAGATESEGNMTEVDQRPNHQGEINGSSEGGTSAQRPGSFEQGVNDSLLNLTSNQASGSSMGPGATESGQNLTVIDETRTNQDETTRSLSGNLTVTKTGAPINFIYGNQYICHHYHGLGGATAAGGAEGEGGRIDKQTAESRAGNVETSQSSLPSAGSAAEAESKAENMETSL